MNRCTPKFIAALAVAATLAVVSLAVQAQPENGDADLLVTRSLPKTALLGRLQVQQPPEVLLNGQPTRLSPGARIRGADNHLAMSGALVGQTFAVKYLLDAGGLVSQAWILTDDEVRASRKRFSLTEFLFGRDAVSGAVDDGKTPFDQLPRYPAQ